jgi:tyrosyl-tRNA synthetase
MLAGRPPADLIVAIPARISDPRAAQAAGAPDEVLGENAKLFAEQAFRILDRKRTEIRFNGEWLGKLDYAEIVRLTRTGTVARLLERDDFAKRFDAGEPISVSELLYPFAQGYDSVAVRPTSRSGTDQLYNLLMGAIMSTTAPSRRPSSRTSSSSERDGVEKMSKSVGN